jgi:acid phosphatase type 7
MLFFLAAVFSIRQVRVNFGKSAPDGQSMVISWQQDNLDNVPILTLSKFQSPDSPRIVFDVSSSDACTYFGSNQHFHVTLKSLDFDQMYKVSFLTDSETTLNFTFKSPPPPSYDFSPFNITVFGDLGIFSHGADSMRAIEHFAVDPYPSSLILHVGDIGYADNSYVHATDYETVYEEYMDNITSKLSPKNHLIPYHVAVGNHESECHSPSCLFSENFREGLRNFTAYNCRFRGMGDEKWTHSMWHEFSYSNIQFISLNTETDFPGAAEEFTGSCKFCGLKAGGFGGDGEYLKWLKTALEEADRNRSLLKPFILTYGHRPLISGSSTRCKDEALCASVGDLIEKYSDLHISGHLHYYARNIPVASDRDASRNYSTVHVTVGGAGCDEWSYRPVKTNDHGKNSQYHWKEFGSDQTIARLQMSSQMELKFVAYKSKAREDGSYEIIDEFSIRKSAKDLTNKGNIFEAGNFHTEVSLQDM